MKRRKTMDRKSLVGKFSLALAAAGVLMMPVPGYPQTQGQERRDDRQDGRDANQQNRQDARAVKADCKAGDEKTRAECRQEKRDAKDGAGAAQDAKPAQ
jgi:hypothetical protein